MSAILNLNICRRKPQKVKLIDILNHELTPAVFFYLALFVPHGMNDAMNESILINYYS